MNQRNVINIQDNPRAETIDTYIAVINRQTVASADTPYDCLLQARQKGHDAPLITFNENRYDARVPSVF